MSGRGNITNKAKGLKLRTITIFLIAVLLALSSFFIVSMAHIQDGCNGMAKAYDECVKYRHDAQMVREGSYYLTEAVHLFVVNGDKKYADNYFKEVHITRRRTDAVEDLRHNTIITSAQQSLLEALEQSEKLKEREIYAIRLVAEAIAEENNLDLSSYLADYDKDVLDCVLSLKDTMLSPSEKRDLAREVVFNDQYLEFRDRIDSNIQTFLDSTYQLTEENKGRSLQKMKNSLRQQCIFIILVLLLIALYSIGIGCLVIKPLKVYMKCIHEGRKFELSGAYEFKHLAITYNKIFEVQHENERMLRQKAELDSLTGLLNRGAFNRVSAQYTDCEINIAALIIDIDNFKVINDTYGHAVGDDVIKSVGEALLSSFRSSDIIARIGGDEFMIIMLDITMESAENIGIKIRNLNDVLQNPTSDLPKTSISVGAVFSEYGYSEELLKRADMALYQTKRNGKCGFSYHEDIIRKPEPAANASRSKKDKKVNG